MRPLVLGLALVLTGSPLAVAGEQAPGDGARETAAPAASRPASWPTPLLAVEAAIRVGNHEAAIARLDALPEPAEPRAAVYRSHLRGMALQGQGQFARSAEAFLLAAQAAARLGWRKGEAVAWRERGRSALLRADYRTALSSWEQRLALEEARDSAHGLAETLGDLGELHARLGDAATALVLAERALTHVEDVVAPELEARLCRNLGVLRAGRGDFEDALGLMDRAREISARIRDEGGVAEALGHAAEIHRTMGDPNRALSLQEKALQLLHDVGDEGEVARAFERLAVIHQARGDDDAALEFQRRAVTLFERGDDGTALVSARWQLAGLLRAAGDHTAALATLQQAHAEAERLRVEDLLLRSWSETATAQLVAGRSDDAAGSARRAVAALPRVLGGLAEEQSAAARSLHADLFAAGAGAGRSVADPALLAFFLESGRAGTLLESLGEREALRGVTVPPALLGAEERAREDEAAALDRYRRAAAEGNRRTTMACRRALEAARNRVKEVIERIQRHAKAEVEALMPPPAELATIQGWLLPGDVMALYGLLADEAIALVITAETTRTVSLGPTEDLTRACNELWLEDASRDVTRSLADLRTMLIDPLDLGEDTRRLLVSPDGAVAYLPLAALAEGLEVAYLPSATTYGLLRRERGRRGNGVLALGDPTYDTRVDPAATASVRSGLTLFPLPSTRAEALSIGDVVLLGDEATEAGFRYSVAKRERWRAVHLACHGVVDTERPTLSALALTTAGNDDGFLTALDVLRLHVPADLVVLSACDSGRGRIFAGEGVLGLMRAFLFAGSPRVVVSLSKVDDEATGVLMQRFYELWEAGASTASALAGAQAHVRSHPRWAHPHYWAGWALWGLPD
ncbi:MAG: CHAT domain-containing protein [Planctomycetota bacterium]|jgi:CHAT domain-containing protein